MQKFLDAKTFLQNSLILFYVNKSLYLTSRGFLWSFSYTIRHLSCYALQKQHKRVLSYSRGTCSALFQNAVSRILLTNTFGFPLTLFGDVTSF